MDIKEKLAEIKARRLEFYRESVASSRRYITECNKNIRWTRMMLKSYGDPFYKELAKRTLISRGKAKASLKQAEERLAQLEAEAAEIAA